MLLPPIFDERRHCRSHNSSISPAFTRLVGSGAMRRLSLVEKSQFRARFLIRGRVIDARIRLLPPKKLPPSRSEEQHFGRADCRCRGHEILKDYFADVVLPRQAEASTE